MLYEADGMNAYGYMPPDACEDERRYRRANYLGRAMRGTRAKLMRLEGEAIELGLLDLVELRNSKNSGDLIAAEWLRRLGE